MIKLFFKVDDTYESYFDKNIVKPLKSKRNIYEGGYTKNLEIEYDYNNKIAIVNNTNNKLNNKKFVKHQVLKDLMKYFWATFEYGKRNND